MGPLSTLLKFNEIGDTLKILSKRCKLPQLSSTVLIKPDLIKERKRNRVSITKREKITDQ